MTPAHKSVPLLVALTLALGGCASPMVLWQPPASPADPGADMSSALAYLGSARNVYREAVADQMNTERHVGNALIGAGALIAALAVGKAHRDAIIGTSLVAGTGYAMGSVNLPRQRVLVYQAGVEALNCAERAVAPYAIGAEERNKLTDALDELQRSRRALSAAMETVRRERDRLVAELGSTDSVDISLADEALRLASAVQQASEQTLRAGREFAAASQRGARELVAAVHTIDAAVARALITSTPDLSSVPQVVSGLAGMVGSFAPGAGIDALIRERLEGVVGAARSLDDQAGMLKRSDLQQATDRLNVATGVAEARHAEAAALLAGRAGTWPQDAFKDCGVAEVVTPLVVVPASLTFTAGVDGRRFLDISGGVKPYFVEFDGQLVEGLTLKPPIRFDSRAELSVAGDKVKTSAVTSLRITDSSPTARFADVPLVVLEPKAAANPSNDKTGGTNTGSGGGPDKNDAIERHFALLKDVSSFDVNGHKWIIRATPTRDKNVFNVRLTCPQGEGVSAKRAAVEKALLDQAGIKDPPKRGWTLTLTADREACLVD